MGNVLNMTGGGGGIKLASIEITTPPTKKRYVVNEVFNPSGMEIVATYSNGMSTVVPTATYIYSPATPLQLGEDVITISYSDNGVTRTTTLPIIVSYKKESPCVSVATSGTATEENINAYSPATLDSIAKKIAKSADITSDTTEVYATLENGDVVLLSANGENASQVMIQMNGTDYTFDIIGFNHDEDGYDKVGITFQMHDLFTTTYPMKSTQTSTDGWHNSDLRNNTMPLLMRYMPAAWQNILVAVNKQTCLNVSDATLNTTTDKLFVPSEWEVFGSKPHAKAQEGTQYAYYKNGGTKLKTLNGSAFFWWERSPVQWNSSRSSSFCFVSLNGSSDAGSGSLGVAPCFCVGSQVDPQPDLDDNSWKTISVVSAGGLGASYWSVGDVKMIHVEGTVGELSVNQDVGVYILGFDHNGATNTIDFGTFKTALTGGVDICLCDSEYGSYSTDGTKYFNMNHSSNTNAGGWKSCNLRFDVLGSTNTDKGDAGTTTATSPVADTLMAALPADLRAVMKPMTVYTDNTGGGSDTASNVTTTVDYLPLLAEFEVFGLRYYANSTEQNYQAKYAYYSAGNSRKKYEHNNTSIAVDWWNRSPNVTNSESFRQVSDDGGGAGTYARYSYGLAPAFRV